MKTTAAIIVSTLALGLVIAGLMSLVELSAGGEAHGSLLTQHPLWFFGIWGGLVIVMFAVGLFRRKRKGVARRLKGSA
jgi:hypothetical protein